MAVDLRWVREVCPLVRLRPLPAGPPWLRGLFDYHGQLLPAVDASVLLGGPEIGQSIGARILLLHGPSGSGVDTPLATFGLLVDGVDGVVDAGTEAWTTRQGLPGMPFIGEVTQGDPSGVLVLEPSRLASMHADLLQGPAVLPVTHPGRPTA